MRLPVSLIERVDAYARALEQQLPGHRVNRSDAVRVLLGKALDAEGIPAPQPKAAKRK